MAAPMEWHEAVLAITPFVVRIVTPQGSGSGFIISHSADRALYGIATAHHVVAYAHEWGLPIRIEHPFTGRTRVLQPADRSIILDSAQDGAAIVFQPQTLDLPDTPPTSQSSDTLIRTGVEIGWLGFPAVAPDQMCFFHGRISAALQDETGYLVDGVAINGVSGGPVIALSMSGFKYVGFVSAYRPNRRQGETLPGLSVVRDLTHLAELVKTLPNFGAAKEAESAPQEPEAPGDSPSA